MSKKYSQEQVEVEQSQEGADDSVELGAEHIELSPMAQEQQIEEGAEMLTDSDKLVIVQDMVNEALNPTDEAQSTTDEVPKVMVTMGIGQFVRHAIKAGKLDNKEILEKVLTIFPGSKTTPACIAWYKTDMRKKGLLPANATRGKNVVIEFSEEELAKFCE